MTWSHLPFLCAYVLLVVGEILSVEPPAFSTLSQIGAVGVLAWVCWYQRIELRDLREQLKLWENVRHQDSNRLNDTLMANSASLNNTFREMSQQCASVQEELKRSK